MNIYFKHITMICIVPLVISCVLVTARNIYWVTEDKLPEWNEGITKKISEAEAVLENVKKESVSQEEIEKLRKQYGFVEISGNLEAMKKNVEKMKQLEDEEIISRREMTALFKLNPVPEWLIKNDLSEDFLEEHSELGARSYPTAGRFYLKEGSGYLLLARSSDELIVVFFHGKYRYGYTPSIVDRFPIKKWETPDGKFEAGLLMLEYKCFRLVGRDREYDYQWDEKEEKFVKW